MLLGIRTVAVMVAGNFKGSPVTDKGLCGKRAEASLRTPLPWPSGFYCSGVMLVSQVAMAVTADRGTASANEQK